MLKNNSNQIFMIDETSSNHVQGRIYQNKAAYDAAMEFGLMSPKTIVFHLGNQLSLRLKDDVPLTGETTFSSIVRVAEGLISELASNNEYQFQKHEFVIDNEWSVYKE